MRHRLSPKAESLNTGGIPQGGSIMQVKTKIKAGTPSIPIPPP